MVLQLASCTDGTGWRLIRETADNDPQFIRQRPTTETTAVATTTVTCGEEDNQLTLQSMHRNMCGSVFCSVRVLSVVLQFLLLSQSSRTASGSFGQEILELRYDLTEEPDIGTYVGDVVTDSDLRFLYSPEVLDMLQLRFLKQSHSSIFLLDGLTGVLRTSNRIDRETICPASSDSTSCVLRVDVAIQPIQFFRIIRLFINIIDINDNSPHFADADVTIAVLETVAIGTGLAIPAASDPDSRPFSVQGYEMLNPVDAIELRQVRRGNESIELRLVIVKSLDRESIARYHVTVTATDGGQPPRSGSLNVIVNVIDVNDNSPVFDAESYRASVVENSPALTPVIRVRADDADAGLNGHVVYEITSLTMTSYGHLFAINNETGLVYVTGSIDFEERQVFDLVVVARDLGSDSVPRTAPVAVHVLDENDNAPEVSIDTLSSLPGRAEVVECGPVGMFVAHVTVVDRDTGSESGRFNCSLDHSHFRLKKVYETEFHVLTSTVLDREQQSLFRLSIICTDFGEEARQSVAELIVGVLDVNDHDPVFQRSVYYGDLIENNYIGAIVFHVNATDRDEGPNSQLRFSVEGQDSSAEFHIDQSSGAVKALVSFDHERVQLVRFRIVARDLGTPSRSATASGHVTIVDVNDERPQFVRQVYHFRLEENEAKGASVGTVKAEDRDSGLNGQISYGLSRASPTSEMFAIDSSSGLLSTLQPLDRETQSVHNLVVIATDSASPSLTGSCSVVVEVSDRNDNRPQFDPSLRTNNTFHVSTHAHRGHVVTQVVARDADAGSHATLSFEISSALPSSSLPFSIDPDLGVVYVTDPLLNMDGQFLELSIIARDRGNPPQATLAFIYVAINSSVAMTSSSVVSGLSQSTSSIVVRYNLTIVIVLSVTSGLITICLITAIVFIRRQDGKQTDQYKCSQRRSKEEEEEEEEEQGGRRMMTSSNGRHHSQASSGDGEKKQQQEEQVKKVDWVGLTFSPPKPIDPSAAAAAVIPVEPQRQEDIPTANATSAATSGDGRCSEASIGGASVVTMVTEVAASGERKKASSDGRGGRARQSSCSSEAECDRLVEMLKGMSTEENDSTTTSNYQKLRPDATSEVVDRDGRHPVLSSLSVCDEKVIARNYCTTTNTRRPSSPTAATNSLTRRRPRDNNIAEFLTMNNTSESFRNATFTSFRSREKDVSGGGQSRWQHKEPEVEKSKKSLPVHYRCLSEASATTDPLTSNGTFVTEGRTPDDDDETLDISSSPPLSALTPCNESTLDHVIVLDGGATCERIDRILLLNKNIRSSNV